MNASSAHLILETAKRGAPVPSEAIERALQETGDLPPDWPAGVVPADPLEVT